MKKVLIGLSGLVIIALVIILFTNAKNSTPEAKKPATELSSGCPGCPSVSAAACETKAEIKKAEAKTCEPAMCGGCTKK